jgi:DNA-binding response OmpR family regulator
MAKQTIFVVDDEPLITRLAQVNLEHGGYQVQIAHDGVAALEALQTGQVQPDLILLDIMLPYLDGFELLNRLKGFPELAAIPVVVMTARAHDKDVVMGHSIGAERYLTKPINPAELLKTVKEVLAERQAATEA